ncbi:hypothetical protein IAR50_001665 [Cryptococcus sp. DSM 104548]
MSYNDAMASASASPSASASATPIPTNITQPSTLFPTPIPTSTPVPALPSASLHTRSPHSTRSTPKGKNVSDNAGGEGDVVMQESTAAENGHGQGHGDGGAGTGAGVVMADSPASKFPTMFGSGTAPSRSGTPMTNVSGGEDVNGNVARKRKISDENARSTRSTRSRLQTPTIAASPSLNPQNRTIPTSSGPQAVETPAPVAAPAPGPGLEPDTNNTSSKAPSPAPISELGSGLGGIGPAADADSIRREAAAGYEKRLRARVPGNVKKDGGQRIGVSASGRDVRIGGSARQAAQAQKKDKGKGRVDGVQPNQDFCSACRGIGRFLCCDGCPRSFHFMCLEPPLRLDELPEEERWLCKHCRAENAKEEDPSPRKQKDLPAIPSVFRALSDKIEEENPEQFRLPTDIRKFFAGVSTGAEGEYVDAKSGRAKIDRKGFLEDRDPFRLRDGRQKKVECFRCGGSSLPKHSVLTDPEATWRQIISCDYCPSSWHLDCLSPPPSIMPSAGRKWMCPNHPDHVMPKRRTLNEGLSVIDVTKPGQHNNGNIEIIVPETTAIGKDGKQFEFEDMMINRKKFRVPEKVVKLDFWNKIERGRGKRKVGEEDGMEVDQVDEAEPEMDDLNAAAMMMALAFSRHTAPPVAAKASEATSGAEKEVETGVAGEPKAGSAKQPAAEVSVTTTLPEAGSLAAQDSPLSA